MAKKKTRWFIILSIAFIVFVIVSASLWFVTSRGADTILVSTQPVQKRTIVQTVNAIGNLQPEFMVKISSEASGEIIYLGARDGDTVQKGQLLVRIQPDLVQTQMAQSVAAADASRLSITIAKAEMDRTDAEFKRINELYKKDYATQEELDRAKAAYEQAHGRYTQAQSTYAQARAALRQTEATASRTTIVSPMAGVVTYLAVENGEKVVGTAQMQGTEIMRIANLNIMNAWVDVDENDVAMLSVGDTARITVDALPDTSFTGIVYEISHSPRATAQGTQNEVINFQVRIRIQNPDKRMRPGMSVSVDIETETRHNVPAVPIQAITIQQPKQDNGSSDDWRVSDRNQKSRSRQNEPQSIVWVSNGTSVRSRPIHTGISDHGYIQVLSGLKLGEHVVTSPFAAVTKLLSDGSKIKVEAPEQRKARFDKLRKGTQE
ncbi:MAG: efflux RND transporter periplasmic adaptor subunit [Chlorobi bacterium]|nr:MAG: efflux RND transporter periplasmic adaptor subunit [Bacteroidota bacterium]KXK35616.1 MAG: efflux transporter, RND family, MFP subunit [Chlorobi bacterium OLB6]MBE2264764.1 efflux RND transporter periplasmic adaptor subunit [Flavobacteriales bacterium]MBL1161241.1 efflux RND transporter periplasmic adaptor subunit [Chlorobiota bacterium]MBW7853706.1 efflux RND transporter periplasmic adaptor subunit [Candidatus Kapabacteria bacterium]MCC6332060.1 efflux RND transporter periplasmic adap